MSQIAVTNASTVVSDADVKAILPALSLQVSRDLASVWSGVEADLVFVSTGAGIPQGAWALCILDDTDQADALGYHDLTMGGQPISKIFAKTDSDYGEDWRVTASHELCEMLCDPEIDQVVTTIYEGKSATTIREVCDAVEGNTYSIDGVILSDFVTPNFFDSAITSGVKYDFLGALSAPMTIAQGGYMSFKDAAGNWTQVFGDRVHTWRAITPIGSRRERLRAGHHRWRRSTAI